MAHQRTASKPPEGLLLKVSPTLAHTPDKNIMASQPAEFPKGFCTVWFVRARDGTGSHELASAPRHHPALRRIAFVRKQGAAVWASPSRLRRVGRRVQTASVSGRGLDRVRFRFQARWIEVDLA